MRGMGVKDCMIVTNTLTGKTLGMQVMRYVGNAVVD